MTLMFQEESHYLGREVAQLSLESALSHVYVNVMTNYDVLGIH